MTYLLTDYTRHAQAEFKPHGEVYINSNMALLSAGFFGGMALECGIKHAEDPVAAAIRVYKTTPKHVLACERVSVLEERGAAPFAQVVADLTTRFARGSGDRPERVVTTVLYAAALGRELLGPLVGNFRACFHHS